jgi:hypothetical protein
MEGTAMKLNEAAWELVAMTVDEAEGAYGLKLHGRVEEEDDGVYLDFAAIDIGIAFRQKIDRRFLDDNHRALFFEFGISPTVRKMAEARDLKERELNETD